MAAFWGSEERVVFLIECGERFSYGSIVGDEEALVA